MDPELESGHPANASPLMRLLVPRRRQTVCLLALLTAVATPLQGCISRTIRLTYEPSEIATGPNVAVHVEVEDRRTFVVDGDRDPAYLGLWRGGYGVPFDVTTESERSLADLIQQDLVRELDALGFRTDADPPAPLLLVAIQQWKFDEYWGFWCEMDVAVFDANGERAASWEFRRKTALYERSWGGSAESAWGHQLRGLYGDSLKAIVRENPEIMSALLDDSGPPREHP